MRLIWYGLTFASVFTLNALHAAEVILAGKKKGAFKVNRECVQYSGYLASLKSSAGIYYTDLDGDELTFLADTLKALEEPNKVEFKDRIYNALVRGKLKIPIDWQRGYLRKFRFVPPVQRQFDNIIMLKTEVDNALTPLTLKQFTVSVLFNNWLQEYPLSSESSFYYTVPAQPFLTKFNILFLLKNLAVEVNNDVLNDKALWHQLIINLERKCQALDKYLTPTKLKSLFQAANFLELPLPVRLVLMQLIEKKLHKAVVEKYKAYFERIKQEVAAREKKLSYPSINDLLAQNVQKLQMYEQNTCVIGFSSTGAKSLAGLSELIDKRDFLPSSKSIIFAFVLSDNLISYIDKEALAIFKDKKNPMYGRLILIDMQNNKVKAMEPEWDSNTGLKILILSYNELAEVKQGMFSCDTLWQLILSANQITKIEPYSFAKLKGLSELRLDNNQLRALEVESLAGLNNLHSLSLAHNNLSTLPIGWASSLTSLQMLNLKGNPLTSLPKGWHRGLDNLKRISIDHTNSELERRIKRDLPEVEIIYKEVGPQGWQL